MKSQTIPYYLFGLTIFLCIDLFSSCQTNNADSFHNFQAIEIPIESSFNVNYSKYCISDSSFIGFNKHSSAIQEISFDDNRLNAQLYSFEDGGPNAGISPSIFTYYNGNYILFDIAQSNIQTLNIKTGNMRKERINFSISDSELGLYNGYAVNPPKYFSMYKDKLLFPVYKLIPRNTANYYDSLYFVELNMSNIKYELKSFKLPSEFINNSWPIHDYFSVIKLDQNKYLFSFEAFSDIFSSDENDILERYEIDLEDYGLKNKVESFGNLDNQIMAHRDREYSRGSQRFFPLKYNTSNNSFYRIIKGETDGNNIVASENLYLYKWDENFNMIGSIPIPTGLLADFSIHNGKFYFQQSEKYAENEDQFILVELSGF